MPVARDPDFEASLNEDYQPQHVDVIGRVVPAGELLFLLDPTSYEQRRAEWREDEIEKLLGDGTEPALFRRNKTRFDELRRLVQRGRIIPFVGAGIGVPCGYPTWRNFLL